MISQDEVIRIALELRSEGYTNSEAYPILRWRKLGYSEDPAVFRAIDAYIKFLKELEKSGCTTTSAGS